MYYEKPYGGFAYKPKKIDFSDLTLTKIKWRHWGTAWPVAVAEGA